MKQPMKDNLGMVFLVVAILLCTAGIVNVAQRDAENRKPIDVSPRALYCDPEFYENLVVRISVEGFQPGEHPLQIVYRSRPELSPIVACELKSSLLDKKYVRGKVGRRKEGTSTVVVINCVPSD